ncbi:hypothetical protein C5S29_03885, partial [ANME-1 cluster archaeon GoMg3.2]|nr:hypothetical protein [ANME-1 cluster archaeon GoMg3.2]
MPGDTNILGQHEGGWGRVGVGVSVADGVGGVGDVEVAVAVAVAVAVGVTDGVVGVVGGGGVAVDIVVARRIQPDAAVVVRAVVLRDVA